MEFKLYKDIKEFYADTYAVFMRNEAQNIVPFGNTVRGYKGIWGNPSEWLMATASDKTGIRLIGFMTPPHRLTLYAVDNKIDEKAIECLIDGIRKTDFTVGGIMTEKTLAEVYAAKDGRKFSIIKNLRIHELTNINTQISLIGKLRPVCESDIAFLPFWWEAMQIDLRGVQFNIEGNAEKYRELLKGFYILEVDGTPVSMARTNREIEHVALVNGVYTPPYFRGKGYATSCVAQVSQIILDRGFRASVLYTDLANPVSNSIYKKIGYEPICDSLEIDFE